ncbi:MAG TPA: response regulator [Prolixibacteraceae bacterium]|nr:response regulator [Prolixibacteraceae bacterium]
MKSINCILLVDDDESDNFFHTLTIQEAEFCNQIKVATDGRYALDYMLKALNAETASEYPMPDIIFLDINMPRMDGFDFLDEYLLLDETKTSGIVIIMLTTSLNPYDMERAMNYKVVRDYRNKPLTAEMLQEIIDKYFL